MEIVRFVTFFRFVSSGFVAIYRSPSVVTILGKSMQEILQVFNGISCNKVLSTELFQKGRKVDTRELNFKLILNKYTVGPRSYGHPAHTVTPIQRTAMHLCLSPQNANTIHFLTNISL
jgi:hypothetical protein